MEGIIINTEQECIDLIAQIDEEFSFLYEGVSKTYTYFLKNLTKDKYLVIIDKARITPLATYYPDKFKRLPYRLEDIVEVDKNNYIQQETI